MLELIMAWFVAQYSDLKTRLGNLKEMVLAMGDAYNHDYEDAAVNGVAATLKRDIRVMVIGIVFVAVGVLIVSELDAALPAISNTGLSSDYETTLGHFGTGITLVGLVLIVLPAISILQRMDVL